MGTIYWEIRQVEIALEIQAAKHPVGGALVPTDP
jgi:hypothetical protein